MNTSRAETAISRNLWPPLAAIHRESKPEEPSGGRRSPPAREAHRPPEPGDSPLLPTEHHSRRSVGTCSRSRKQLLAPTRAVMRG
ncbi:hypothetical protein TNCV_1032061 [Trichonephila clavipes]|nr:hypothetical protein TNCV_1032061 [Trichonephila clavipes]